MDEFYTRQGWIYWEPEQISYMNDKYVDTCHCAADATRGESRLDWVPEYSSKEGLAKIIEWHVQKLDSEHVREDLEIRC
jgi:nucleoside-diphosphate-sugar epimerase